MSETHHTAPEPALTLKHRVEFVLFAVAGAFVRMFPRRSLYRVGSILAAMAYPVLRSRRLVTLRNLRNAFPDRSEAERDEIARESFRSVATAFLEFLTFEHMTADDVRRLIRVENTGLLTDVERRQRGAIFLTAHFGNWELAAASVTVYSGRPLHIIVKRQANRLVDRVIDGWRTRFGGRTVSMEHAPREVMRVLGEGALVALAADQAASKESTPIEFFGRMVPTFGGPAVFALRTNTPIILGLPVRQSDGTYVMHLQEVPLAGLPKDDAEAVTELTRRHVRMTEDCIRQHPGQWMWMHKRWKHVPDRPEVQEVGRP